jgi:hypothetical protein
MKVRLLELRKEVLDTGQRLKMKVEPAVKFSPPRILSWIRHWMEGTMKTYEFTNSKKPLMKNPYIFRKPNCTCQT